MKKLLLCALGLMICLFAACRKDNRIQKVYLLRQQIYDDRADGIPLDTTNFTYNNQNQLTLIRTGYVENNISFTISYDAAGRVSVAKKLNGDGSVIKEFAFFYGTSTGYIINAPSKKADTAIFTFNDNSQVTRIQTLHGGYTTYTYDSRGNIASLKNYFANGSNDLYDENYYTYDTHKSYFSEMAPNNYFLMFVLYSDASTNINNVVTKNADTYAYTYNNDGFPIKATAKVIGRAITPIYYNYIVK
jgi:hypothetical protein